MPRKYVFNVSGLKPRRKSLRHISTQAEKMLWERLRKESLGYKFFRQYSVEGYVLDFYCPEKRLGLEIEGGIHKQPDIQKYDIYRFKYLQAFSINILRFTNQEIFTGIGKVVEIIQSNLRSPS